ncbi:MAG: glycosyltransferase [Hydrogenophaga sp.]|nr:glycosyltransferase [Hydrogenophaga sp.]
MAKISYLVSTYDSGHFLDAHLADLLENQTDPDFEIVVVNPDSPSTDGLIAQKWAAVDDRVKYIYWPVREPYGASWLRAWRNATGEFVMNSNTDDFHVPQTTELVHKHMKVATGPMHIGSKIAFCYGGLTVINEQRQIQGRGLKPPFDFELMSRECWAGPQVAWRNDKDFLKDLDWNLMDERAASHQSAFDYWLWLYFMSKGYHGHVIEELITVYTQRPDSIENRNKWANNWETYASISEFFGHNFDGHLKHAREFRDFGSLPPKEEWVATMQAGKKWRTSKHGGTG